MLAAIVYVNLPLLTKVVCCINSYFNIHAAITNTCVAVTPGEYLRWHRGKYLKGIYFCNTKKGTQRSKKSKNNSEIALTTY
jgi:hypothetical protein